jgi:hypothetical protein
VVFSASSVRLALIVLQSTLGVILVWFLAECRGPKPLWRRSTTGCSRLVQPPAHRKEGKKNYLYAKGCHQRMQHPFHKKSCKGKRAAKRTMRSKCPAWAKNQKWVAQHHPLITRAIDQLDSQAKLIKLQALQEEKDKLKVWLDAGRVCC